MADILKKFEKKTCQIAFHVVLLMSFPGVAQLGEEKCRRLWKRINDSITEAVDTLMLSQLIEESRKKQQERILLAA